MQILRAKTALSSFTHLILSVTATMRDSVLSACVRSVSYAARHQAFCARSFSTTKASIQSPLFPLEGAQNGDGFAGCEVLLGPRVSMGVSGHHFSITFDEEANLKLIDRSTRGTDVSFKGQAKEKVRRKFVWKLNQEKDEWRWDVGSSHSRGSDAGVRDRAGHRPHMPESVQRKSGEVHRKTARTLCLCSVHSAWTAHRARDGQVRYARQENVPSISGTTVSEVLRSATSTKSLTLALALCTPANTSAGQKCRKINGWSKFVRRSKS